MQSPAWFPYFDDCDAIIFLAPISCFDERLAEDRKVNRLEDSYMLWRLVCASKLLQNTQMILFLNKYDLLDQKLRRGVKVKDHVRSYGDRPNDVETVSKCRCWLLSAWTLDVLIEGGDADFSQHFREIMKRHSPQPRQFRVHMTSVIVSAIHPSYLAVRLRAQMQDTKATAVTLGIGTSPRLSLSPSHSLITQQSRRASCRHTSAPWSSSNLHDTPVDVISPDRGFSPTESTPRNDARAAASVLYTSIPCPARPWVAERAWTVRCTSPPLYWTPNDVVILSPLLSPFSIPPSSLLVGLLSRPANPSVYC